MNLIRQGMIIVHQEMIIVHQGMFLSVTTIPSGMILEVVHQGNWTDPCPSRKLEGSSCIKE
jgi:hypothetical protein